MKTARRRMYPKHWPQLAYVCKEAAGWRCQRCHIKQGSWRRSKRTGNRYRVWLHAAHVHMHDTHNPQPELWCLCPSCHGSYDYRLRLREQRVALERLKHQRQLRQRGFLHRKRLPLKRTSLSVGLLRAITSP